MLSVTLKKHFRKIAESFTRNEVGHFHISEILQKDFRNIFVTLLKGATFQVQSFRQISETLCADWVVHD